MKELKKLTGIPQKELLYHLLSGLKYVEKNLKKYPDDIQLKSVTFSFSTKEVIESNRKLSIFVGLENANAKEYSEGKSSTFSFSESLKTRYQPLKYKWKESGLNLQLEFAGMIMRKIANEIIIERAVEVKATKIIIENNFTLTKSKNGILQLKILNDKLDISANRKSAKTVTNSYKILFELNKKKL